MTQPLSIPHHVKIEAFFWEGTAKQIAGFLAQYYRRPSFTGSDLIIAWMDGAETNPLLREERPPEGFPKDKRELGLKLLQEMRVAA